MSPLYTSTANALATKLNNLSSMHETHGVKWQSDSHRLSSDLNMHLVVNVPAYVHIILWLAFRISIPYQITEKEMKEEFILETSW